MGFLFLCTKFNDSCLLFLLCYSTPLSPLGLCRSMLRLHVACMWMWHGRFWLATAMTGAELAKGAVLFSFKYSRCGLHTQKGFSRIPSTPTPPLHEVAMHLQPPGRPCRRIVRDWGSCMGMYASPAQNEQAQPECY